MFLMIGISDGRKDLDFSQSILCRSCGKYGRYQVFMTYTVLLLFFIPCFKWNRRYYVQTSCCGKIYELDPEVGKRIARGENVEIRDDDLQSTGYSEQSRGFIKSCAYCGYTTYEDFQYCPKCGREL